MANLTDEELDRITRIRGGYESGYVSDDDIDKMTAQAKLANRLRAALEDFLASWGKRDGNMNNRIAELRKLLTRGD